MCCSALPLEAFSEAQLLGKRKCLRCSNPRLFAKRAAAELEQSVAAAAHPRPAKPVRTMDMTRECSCCGRHVPIASFSARQLAGKGRCPACACMASHLNQQEQQRAKRPRYAELIELGGAVEELSDAAESDDSEAEYERELLRGVEEARAAAAAAAGAQRPEQPLDASNAGHQMLRKLGWTPGSGLGAPGHDGAPQPEPVPASEAIRSQRDRRGLGLDAAWDRATRSPPPPSPPNERPNERVDGAGRRARRPPHELWAAHGAREQSEDEEETDETDETDANEAEMEVVAAAPRVGATCRVGASAHSPVSLCLSLGDIFL